MADVNIDRNLSIYSNSEVVAHYAAASGLQPCEAYAFERWVKPGVRIIDIGVGGGRTTPFLAKLAQSYLGVDYSQAMVDACARRLPSLEFRCLSARNLVGIEDCAYDVAVFSFNGIDYISSDEDRRACLEEVRRVLAPGGLFVFSSHNAQGIGVWPQLQDIGLAKKAWRLLRAVFKSLEISIRTVRSGVFFADSGYLIDPDQGGLRIFACAPRFMIAELESKGFRCREVINGCHPAKASTYFTPWYYYVATREG